MANTTDKLKNVNLLTKEQFDGISDLASDELYAVEAPTIVETYSDAAGNWYRIYADGGIEQGGLAAKGGGITITFLKAFSNTNYTVVATSMGTNGEIYGQCINKISTTQIKFSNTGGSANMPKSWYACGF